MRDSAGSDLPDRPRGMIRRNKKFGLVRAGDIGRAERMLRNGM